MLYGQSMNGVSIARSAALGIQNIAGEKTDRGSDLSNIRLKFVSLFVAMENLAMVGALADFFRVQSVILCVLQTPTVEDGDKVPDKANLKSVYAGIG